jgi:hypothetical protein
MIVTIEITGNKHLCCNNPVNCCLKGNTWLLWKCRVLQYCNIACDVSISCQSLLIFNLLTKVCCSILSQLSRFIIGFKFKRLSVWEKDFVQFSTVICKETCENITFLSIFGQKMSQKYSVLGLHLKLFWSLNLGAFCRVCLVDKVMIGQLQNRNISNGLATLTF